MKHVVAAIAAFVAVFLAATLAASCASAHSVNAVSARAPGFALATEAKRPSLSRAPSVTAGFPNEGWTSQTPMASPRWAHAMATYSVGTYPTNNAFVYVISGADQTLANTSLMSRYDVTLGSWSDQTPMVPSRTQIGAAQIGGKIYVPGGYGGSFSPVTTLSIYDIATDAWTTGAPLPQATGDYAIGSYADRYLYVIGGYTGAGDINNVQVYDTTTDTWQAGTPKPGTATAGLRGGIVGDHIIVVGGYSQILAAEEATAVVGTIDPVTPTSITWTATSNYPGGPVGRFGAGVPVAAGPAQGSSALNFVLFTGGDPNGAGTTVKNDTWLYDFNTNTWKSGPPKPTGVSNIGNMAGVASGGKMSMVTTGGYDGTSIVAVNEWLQLGYEAPADLALTMSDGGVPIQRGATVLYNLAYAATGAGTAPAATISDTVPAGTAFDAGASTPGWTCAPDASAGSVCAFSLGHLASGASGSVLFAVDSITPVASATTQIVDTAVISTVGIYGAEQNTANNQATVTTLYVVPTSLDLVGGSSQSTTVGMAFAAPLAVHVADANGNGVVGVAIDFAAPATGAGASLSAAAVITDNNGDASVDVTANTIAGAYTISASATGFSLAPLSFALSNTAGPAALISIIAGSPQSTSIGTAFSAPLVAQVRDADNNALEGVDVTFTAPASGPSALLSATSATTDANGIAIITATANEEVGAYAVSASVEGPASPGTFALTNLVADVALSASIDDQRDFAQYAHTLDYIITIANAGATDARHVDVSSSLAAQVDTTYASWTCLGSGTCMASGSGNLEDADVTIPAHGSVSWILSAPIRVDANEVPVVTSVSASSPDQVAVATASDTTTLVIFRDGVDHPYADGADGGALEALAMPLRGGAGMKVSLPPVSAARAVDTVLDARGPGASAFRVDRLTYADGTWLRLATTALDHHEQATAWLRIDRNADIVLHLASRDATRSVVMLVNGSQAAQLDLGNVGLDPVYVINAAPADTSAHD